MEVLVELYAKVVNSFFKGQRVCLSPELADRYREL